MLRKLWAIIVLAFTTHPALAQQNDLGSWNILNVKYNYSEKWSGFVEAQLRSLRFYNSFHYYEYKGGVNYRLNKSVGFTLGAGSYQTYKEGGNFVSPKNNNEFRLWPQVVLFQSIGLLKIEQRYRAEFRYTSNGYRNRFRYRLGVSHAFGKEKDGYQPFQVSASNELFFKDKEPYFERNRFLMALNYKPTKATQMQIGYLHQFDYKINDETGKDFLQLGWFVELFRKKSSKMPVDTNINDN